MKILVLGSNGMAGHMISMYLKEETSYDIITLARNNADIVMDIEEASKKEIGQAILSESPMIVINCIGVLTGAAEQQRARAVYVNSFFPHLLEEILSDTEIKLIHLSTDCIWNGSRGYYDEQDIPNADDWYGKTKALGEVINNKDLTLRLSIIGPELKKNGTGLFHWFMKQQSTVTGYHNALWTGITTLELAKCIDKFIQQPDITGLYHLVSPFTIRKDDLLRIIQHTFNKMNVDIKSVAVPVCDKSMVDTRKLLKYVVSSYSTMLAELREWICNHSELYKHANYIIEE